MIHLRYDWRRPLVWVAISLTFFFSSQNAIVKRSDENGAEIAKTSIHNIQVQNKAMREFLNANKSGMYLFIVKE